jgi:hypothetical protein
MTAVHVFDPAMCCSTGICGPAIDPRLVRFATDLDWLEMQGVSVERFNLSQQPGKFAADAAVKSALETKGEAGLPLVKVNGEVKSIGVYPSRAELAAWAGVAAPALLRIVNDAKPEGSAGGCCGPVTTAASASKKTTCC